MGSVPTEVGGFGWARLWVGDVDVGLLCGSAMTMTAMKMVGLESGLTWIMKVLGLEVGDVHEIYTIKYSHIYIFSLTFMLFCD